MNNTNAYSGNRPIDNGLSFSHLNNLPVNVNLATTRDEGRLIAKMFMGLELKPALKDNQKSYLWSTNGGVRHLGDPALSSSK